ncbi:MAG: hypothetical protein WAM60_21015, partial [Candidatus Promineifilaceae bacterium]
MKKKIRFFFLLILLIGLSSWAVGCQSKSEPPTSAVEVSSEPTSAAVATEPALQPTETAVPTETPAPQLPDSTIIVDVAGAPTALSNLALGTNIPAWLSSSRLQDDLFQERTTASGVSMLRIPGGSWSNAYDWLACERDGNGIDDSAECYWPWAAHPTDFLNFLEETDLAGMYTVNLNGTAKEAAALVAFFNGSVDDDTVIGVDIRGRDWGNVSDWASL